MWNKLILGVVLVAFVGLQIVNGLTCYTCNSPSACRSPSVQTCNQNTANTTSNWLSAIHSNVPDIKSNDYKCMNLTYFYYATNTKVQEILGCFYASIPVCSLELNATNSYQWANNCKTCSYDKCNRNPAGTFSKSSYTIVASVLALIVAKLAL